MSSGAVPASPPSPIAPEERRLVTALFCDLVGFTPLSEQLDPEEVRDIQADYFGRMAEQIERYGGVVEKYAGDAVLALFGTPIAHEDDAERAVLCALGMQAAIEPVAEQVRGRWHVEPAIRVGVDTGEVVSGTWSASGRQDVAVTGDAINTAARLQVAADPGEVLVGPETMHLTRREVRYGERRELMLKGKLGTVPAYPALGVREQFGERWETSEEATPLVGRDRELLELLDAWIRGHEGEGQLVTLVGEAGVGKSRLITELLGKVGSSAVVRVIRARCLSYGQEISLWLIADLLRALFAIKEYEAVEQVQSKLGVGVRSILEEQDQETQAEALDVLGEVLGLPRGSSLVSHADARIRRQALIRDFRLLFSALAERAPTILVLEDLHWIDEASVELLVHVLSDVPGLRLLVLAAQRPGWTAPWIDWGWTQRLTVRPLKEEEGTLLAAAVLGGASLSTDLERYVADRTGGNPFFVEEMLLALREAGGLEQRDSQVYLVPGIAERLPSTLTEVLLARLDRLEGSVRLLAQVASVIGRSFAVRLLAQVMGVDQSSLDPLLTALQRAEIAFPRRGHELEYVFKHVSMREVAYNTLVQRRRQELHRATARAIAQLYPSDEYVEMIAYHFGRTEEHGEAAEWLERAGDRAAGAYANETALDNYQEARRRLELSGAEPIALARLDEKRGAVLLTMGRYDEALAVLERSLEIYGQSHDPESAGRVMAQIGLAHRHRGTALEGIARLQPMLETLAPTGPSPGLAALHLTLMQLFFGTGRYHESLRAAEQAAELARAIRDDRLVAEAEMRRGTALNLIGQLEEARQVLEVARPLAEAVGDLNTLRLVLLNLGEAHRLMGNLDLARQYAERGLEVAQRIGDPGLISFTFHNLGEILSYLGEWDHAQVHLEQAAEILRPLGTSWYAAYPPVQLGRLRLFRGDWQEASRLLEQAVAVAGPGEDRQALEMAQSWLAEIDLLQGRPKAARERLEPLVADEDATLPLLLPFLALVHLDLGEHAHAEKMVEEAVRLATEQQQRLYLVDALRVKGIVLAGREHWQEARRALDEGLELARSLPYPYAEARILEQLGLLEQHQGEPEQAQERLEGALMIFRRLGAQKDIERMEQEPAARDRSADPAR